jgi:membrane protein implicated in regulation of membrane protease activity
LVKLSPRIKFILITVDELLLVPLLILGAYYFIPELLPFTIVATILGAIVFVAAKYHLIYDSLKEGTDYQYDLEGTRCKVTETVTTTAGKVKVGAEIWDARSDNGEILPGTLVVVVSRDSMKVHVKPWLGETN